MHSIQANYILYIWFSKTRKERKIERERKKEKEGKKGGKSWQHSLVHSHIALMA